MRRRDKKEKYIGVRLTPGQIKILEDWSKTQPVPPNMSAIVRAALDQWIERNVKA